MTTTTTIQVRRETIFRRGLNRPFKDWFYCTGPDGTKFDNGDKATLKQVLTRRYDKVTLTIVDGPSARPR
jgi:hypothetical protein